MSIKETIKKEWFVLVLLAMPFLASVYFWDRLPDQMPTHFNIHGEADQFGPKKVVAFQLPGIAFIVYVLMLVLPLIDPKKKISISQKPVAAIRIFTSLFFVGVYAMVLAISLGYGGNPELYIRLGTGALILLVGNYLNSVKHNYFIGVRTPWTLESPEVWKKTHRITSKIWTIGGLLMIISSFLFGKSKGSLEVFVVFLLGITTFPIVYSYLIYRKIQKTG